MVSEILLLIQISNINITKELNTINPSYIHINNYIFEHNKINKIIILKTNMFFTVNIDILAELNYNNNNNNIIIDKFLINNIVYYKEQFNNVLLKFMHKIANYHKKKLYIDIIINDINNKYM
jgi:hypothetical protein